ncbi:MAG: hypothetical protein JSS81_16280 [Acidobacteria bacterium]|nr:hypothetical protein [Acidobacteriota bacterium]
MATVIEKLFSLVGSLRPSTIEFVTSAGAEATGGEAFTAGVTIQGIQLKDNSNGKIKWLTFYGAGAGVGLGFPIGGSASTPDFPSFGSKILRGPTNWGQLELTDLIGGLGQIWAFSAAAGAGVGGSLVFFGCLVPPPLPPVVFKAALWVEGVVIASPGLGVMGYQGIWTLES